MSETEKKKYDQIYFWLAMGSILLLEIFFFRNILFSDNLLGDLGDGRLNNLLVEHWFEALSGKETFREIIGFYPVQNTISYTDMNVLFAIPYCVLRFFGVGMYLANKIVLIGVHVLGSYSLYYLLRKKFMCTRVFSLIGIALFSCSSAYSMKINHTQLIAISFVSLLFIFIISFFQYKDNSKKRILFGILAVSMLSLLMYTSFYIAYFVILFAGLFAVSIFLVSLFGGRRPWRAVVSYIKEFWKSLAGLVVYGVILVTPFFMMYLPTSKMFGARDWGLILYYLPKPLDILNVSKENWLFGGLMQSLEDKGIMSDFPEVEIGFTFIAAILLLITGIFLFYKMLKKKDTVAIMDIVIVSAFVAVILSLIFMIKIGDKTLWYIIYHYLPGGSALRAVGRYMFFLSLPVAIMVAYGGSHIPFLQGKAVYRNGIAILLLAVVLVSNIRVGGVASSWTISEEEAEKEKVSAPPEECKVMYILDSSRPNQPGVWNYHLFAWTIADMYHIKTINGYSGQFPIGWDLQEDINNMVKINHWIQKNHIKNVYAYDIATGAWMSHEEANIYMQNR